MAEQRSTSPFAASMALYSGHLRNRVTQAYAEAQAMMAQQQMSEQERRKTLLAMYKADMANIKALRARIPRLKQIIAKEKSKAKGEPLANELKIRNLMLKATDIRVNATETAEAAVTEVWENVDKSHDVGPTVTNAINKYVETVPFSNPALKTTNWKGSLPTALGVDVGNISGLTTSKRALADVTKEFQKMGDTPKRKRALDMLVSQLERSAEENMSRQTFGTGSATGLFGTSINEALMRDPSFGGHNIKEKGLGLRTNDKQQSALKEQARKKEAARARKSLGPAYDAAEQYRELQGLLDNLKKDAPEAAEEINRVLEIRTQIGDAQTSADALRKKLMEPSEAPSDIREVAGGILLREDQTLEQIAEARAKQRAISLEASSMPGPLKKFLGHLMGAKKYMSETTDGTKTSSKLGGQWVTAAKYADAMMQQTGPGGEPLNIEEMYEQVARDIPDEDMANKVETIATARIMEAWNQGKAQRDKESKVALDIQKSIEGEAEEAIELGQGAKEADYVPYERGEFDWTYAREAELSPFWKERKRLEKEGRVSTIKDIDPTGRP